VHRHQIKMERIDSLLAAWTLADLVFSNLNTGLSAVYFYRIT